MFLRPKGVKITRRSITGAKWGVNRYDKKKQMGTKEVNGSFYLEHKRDLLSCVLK